MAEIKNRQTDRQTDKDVRQQTDCQVVVLGQMDNTIDHTFESANRVYDKNQLCPTIPTCAGGGIQPKVIEETRCVGGVSESKWGNKQYHQQDRVYKGDIALAHPANIPGGSYKYIVEEGGENINYVEGFNYEKEKRISEVLCILRSKIGTESFSEWAIRGLYCFLKKEVLRQRMYAKIILENWRKSTDLGQFTSDCKVDKSTATPEEELRDLWKDWEARCTPYRRQLSEQQNGQLKNYMQELSYENTPTENILLCLWEASEGVGILRKALSEIQEIWESDVDEQRTQTCYRIRKLTPRETWRLMGYTDADFDKAASVNSNSQLYKEAGNAIVKQVLMAIFSQMGIKGVPKWNETKEVIE